MNELQPEYFSYSLFTLLLAGCLATVFTSLRFTGEAGVTRLLEREGRSIKQLRFWKDRWNLLCKASRLLLTLSTIATFVLFHQSLKHCSTPYMLAGLFILSIIYMIVARIIPHVLSESHADRISLFALPLVGAFTLLLYLFVWPLQYIEDHLLRHALSTSDNGSRPSTEDEIISLIEDSNEEELEEEEREIIRSVFEFGETITREVMVPRIDISGIKDSLTVGECVEQVKESRHSRFPVYHENIDDVVGMVHVKDLLKYICDGEQDTPISQLAKRIEYVPETMPLNDLLKLMKTGRAQMVLVVDEYGGTEGLVTMEDVIEELVGEIEDEYDLKENDWHKRSDGSVMVQSRMPIYELNEELGSKLPESDEYDSLGGYIYAELGRIPGVGETVEVPGYTLRIQSATNRQVQVVQMIPKPDVV